MWIKKNCVSRVVVLQSSSARRTAMMVAPMWWKYRTGYNIEENIDLLNFAFGIKALPSNGIENGPFRQLGSLSDNGV